MYSWRNFGNVGAFSQKKQQTFQRGGAQYMKKEKPQQYPGHPSEPGQAQTSPMPDTDDPTPTMGEMPQPQP